MVYADPVATHEVLDGLICSKVDGMSGPCTDNDARHTPPQAHDALAGGHSVCSLDHTIVDGGRGRVQDLHSSLWDCALGINTLRTRQDGRLWGRADEP